MLEKYYKIAKLLWKTYRFSKDKRGNYRITHPVRIALQMKTNEEIIVALLHDIIEDNQYDDTVINDLGLSKNELKAIRTLTKHPDYSTMKEKDKVSFYARYLANIKNNPLAKKIKIADLKDNLSPKRIRTDEFLDLIRNIKYVKAISYLKGQIDSIL